uniref:Uncharacterized protein MANES_06G020200 n=1 Tax=Rhizophora mucronata TaxID=61149 RepID=A0A2P2JM96_RHIMU
MGYFCLEKFRFFLCASSSDLVDVFHPLLHSGCLITSIAWTSMSQWINLTATPVVLLPHQKKGEVISVMEALMQFFSLCGGRHVLLQPSPVTFLKLYAFSGYRIDLPIPTSCTVSTLW